ncbi:uncharacterized protein LOC135152075 isoform X1 [Daucus carota subsp. sativus]|uniref:uncharacterized protein LOC135152075 isoform X1 n=1 Tax=Daucus carota subsp. sativus TaxID=79200 RepID=UPI003083C6F2
MSSRSRLWCDSCGSNRDTQTLDDGRACCSFCGKLLVEDNYSEEVTFAKDAGGQSRAQGTLNRLASGYSASRDRTLDGAYEDMQWMLSSVFNDDDSNVLRRARNFYRHWRGISQKDVQSILLRQLVFMLPVGHRSLILSRIF